MVDEAFVQQQLRLDASCRGMRLWRNNVGMAFGKDGRPIRFGLANDSAQMNKLIKSSDLIGITPHFVLPEDVGKLFGVFTSIEAKHSDWTYTGKGREAAQKAWIDMVLSMGGIAKFSTGEL